VPMQAPLSSSQGTAGEVRQQQTALVFRNAGFSQFAHVLNGALLALVGSRLGTPAWLAILWCLAIALIAAWRYQLSRQFHRAPEALQSPPSWRHHYLWATGAAALAWAASPFLFAWHAPDASILFTGFVLAGLAAGAVPALAPIPAAFRILAAGLTLPYALVVLLQTQSAFRWPVAILVCAFLVALLGLKSEAGRPGDFYRNHYGVINVQTFGDVKFMSMGRTIH